MARLPVITAPDRRLKIRSKPVARVDDRIRALIDGMVETMYAAPGMGLAAVQVGVAKRVIVVDSARHGQEPQLLRLINPELVWASDELVTYEEGCLSLPEFYAEITRPRRSRSATSTPTARTAPSRPTAFRRPVCSTRWTTSTAFSSSTICRR